MKLRVEKKEKLELNKCSNVCNNDVEGQWRRKDSSHPKPQLFFTPNNLLLASADKITLYKSPITAPYGIALDEGWSCLATHCDTIFACATNNQVLLLHWDSILGEWERLVVSEGEGRISSLSVVVEGQCLFLTAVKLDSVVVYRLHSLHPLSEEGPLVLESIQDVALVERKSNKELCSHSFAFLANNNDLKLVVIEVSSNIKMFEIDLDTGKSSLLRQQSVSGGGTVGVQRIGTCEMGSVGQERFLLLMGTDGSGCIYCLQPMLFNLVNRFKLEEGDNQVQVLCAKFLIQCLTAPTEIVPQTTPAVHRDLLPEQSRPGVVYPQLLLIVVTTRRVVVYNAKSGHVICYVNTRDLVGVEELLVQEAILGGNDKQLKLALQSPLSSTIQIIHLIVDDTTKCLDPPEKLLCSLISSEALDPKSVLRKRIKSPLRVDKTAPKRKSVGKTFVSKTVKPAWARSRSRPHPVIKKSPKKSSNDRSHSQSSSGSNTSIVRWEMGATMTPRPMLIPRKGSYEDEMLRFSGKFEMSSRLSGGQSYARMALSPNGRLLAGGGSTSPVGVMRTLPAWDTLRLLKDISRVTALHFNFHSNLLLVGSNDGTTRVVGWEKDKQLLCWNFSSKFNEHIHTQFYFMDKFVVQPQGSDVVMYAIKEMQPEVEWMKLLAATFPFPHCQQITAMAAANLFLSHQIVVGLSNKSVEVFDVNAEKVSLSLPATHSKPALCIRLNEAPKGLGHHDVLLTASTTCPLDPIKLWDLRTAHCVLRICDSSGGSCLVGTGTARPALSPCGRFVATGGVEDNTLLVYDTRKVLSRMGSFALGSTVLDCAFDTTNPMIWAQCRNGSLWNLHCL